MDLETTVNCLFEIRMQRTFSGLANEWLEHEVASSKMLSDIEKHALAAALRRLVDSDSDETASTFEQMENIFDAHAELAAIPSLMFAKALSGS